MNNSLIILVHFFIVLTYAEVSGRCRQECHRGVTSKIECIREGGRLCRKIHECSLKAENCRRRSKNFPAITTLHNSLCRNIKISLGTGRCAPCPIRHNCNNIRCTIPTDIPKCYRSKKNNCRLLTSCELARVNCGRCRNDQIQLTDQRACAGLRAEGKKQICRPISKLG